MLHSNVHVCLLTASKRVVTTLVMLGSSTIFSQCVPSPPTPTDVLVNPVDPFSPVYTKPRTTIISAPNSSTVLTSPQAVITVAGNVDVVAFSYKLDAQAWSAWSPSTTISLSDLDEGKHMCVIRALHRDMITIEGNPPSVDFTVNAVTGPAVMFSPREKRVLIGSNFNYYIIAEEVVNLYGVKIVFSYDNTALGINSITSGTISNVTVQLLEMRYANKARVEMFFTGNGPLNGITGSDTIAVINCASLKVGESAVTFVSDSLEFRNSSNLNITINQVVNGRVVVK